MYLLQAIVIFALPFIATSECVCNMAIVPEGTLRKSVKSMKVPFYPPQSIAKGTTGRVIALIETNGEGVPVKVTALEAPDKYMEQSTISALKEWRFEQMKDDDKTPFCLRGKLTFYFRIVNGRGTVQAPGGFASSEDKSLPQKLTDNETTTK